MTDLVRRFWERVSIQTTGCWIWGGGKTSRGYGAFAPSHTSWIAAHRFAWEITRGQRIPTGLLVLHHCDTPLCVRPSHLFLGSQQDNMNDKVNKERQSRGEPHGRYNRVKTQCPQGHPYSGSNLLVGGGKRRCRQCMREKDRIRRPWRFRDLVCTLRTNV